MTAISACTYTLDLQVAADGVCVTDVIRDEIWRAVTQLQDAIAYRLGISPECVHAAIQPLTEEPEPYTQQEVSEWRAASVIQWYWRQSRYGWVWEEGGYNWSGGPLAARHDESICRD